MTDETDKERRAEFVTPSGLPVERVYGPADVRPDIAASLGAPGEFPYTRGIHRTMYRGRTWTMRQYAGFGTAEEANARYHFLLRQGTTGLSVAFDLPTQMGRDSDHSLARGEVGRVGVAISSVRDMEVLLDGIPLDQVSISMTINATAMILLAMVAVVAERRGVPLAALRGTVQNDILKEYIARGTYIYPPGPALRLVTDLLSHCAEHIPQWNTISISGYHIREAGSTAVDEIAFTLADAIAYVDAARRAGLAVDRIGPRLAFFFNCHLNFLEEVAKFRAARRLWATIMRDRFGAKDARSQMLRFHTQTAGSSLTAQQPLNNVVRTTVEAMAAVFGGTQSLHTNGYDEALGLPTEESALLALRTQQILASETGIADSVDPLAGSYLVESWTDRLEQAARVQIERIDQLGGMVAAIEQGFPQREIDRAAYQTQMRIEKGDLPVVGVNVNAIADERDRPAQRLDPQGEARQCARLGELRAKRDRVKTEQALASVRAAAAGTANLMPLVMNALRADATLGEIAEVLRGVFGEYRQPSLR